MERMFLPLINPVKFHGLNDEPGVNRMLILSPFTIDGICGVRMDVH